MAEIQEELIFEVACDFCRLITAPGAKDKVAVEGIDLTSGQAATLAWLINHAPGTQLNFEVRLA